MALDHKELSERTDGLEGIANAVQELACLITEKEAQDTQRAQQIEEMVKTMQGMVTDIASIKTDVDNVCHTVQQAALNGVNLAGTAALESLEETTQKCNDSISTMVQESRRRIERLAMITLSDRLFYVGKWVALILVLIIACHILWQMVF